MVGQPPDKCVKATEFDGSSHPVEALRTCIHHRRRYRVAAKFYGESKMRATVTAKGRITIPKPVRDLLGIGPVSKVDFRRAADGSVVLVRADEERSSTRFARLRGHAGKGLATDAIMAMTRGET